jgi:hypothetical protein
MRLSDGTSVFRSSLHYAAASWPAQCCMVLGLLDSIIIGRLSNISGAAADDRLQRPLAIGERLCLLRKPGLKHTMLPCALGVAG